MDQKRNLSNHFGFYFIGVPQFWQKLGTPWRNYTNIDWWVSSRSSTCLFSLPLDSGEDWFRGGGDPHISKSVLKYLYTIIWNLSHPNEFFSSFFASSPGWEISWKYHLLWIWNGLLVLFIHYIEPQIHYFISKKTHFSHPYTFPKIQVWRNPAPSS